MPALARLAGVARVLVKAEGERPLGSFKSLGGMTAGLRALARAAGVTDIRALRRGNISRALPCLICASEGNHGLAVAAAAQKAGTKAVVYLAAGVNPARAARIEACGAHIVRVEGTFDDAVLAARAAAGRGEGLLISDTSADPDDPVVVDVMSGYGLIAQELATQFLRMRERPSHLFVQAGVGGLAAAMVEGLHGLMRSPANVAIVEPELAACVAEALAAAHPVRIQGNLRTSAEMLSCGVASAPALRVLQRHDVYSVLVPDSDLKMAAATMQISGGPRATASGAAGLAGLLRAAAQAESRDKHMLRHDSVVLLIATEQAISTER